MHSGGVSLKAPPDGNLAVGKTVRVLTLGKNPMQRSDEKPSSPKGDSGGGTGLGSLGQDSGRAEAGEDPWSPPQFSLRSLMIAVTAFSFACAAIWGFQLDWAGGFIALAILCLFGWLIFNSVRIVRLSRRAHLLHLLRRKRKRDTREQWLEHARWLNEEWAKEGRDEKEPKEGRS